MAVANSKAPEWQPTSSAQVSKDFLSEADDLLTRYLFDWVLFDEPLEGGRRTGKMNLEGVERQQRAVRTIGNDVALCAQVIKELRAGQCSVQAGIDRLAKVRAFEEFGERYEDGDMLFHHHLRRYLLAFAPDSKVAFHETNRYARQPKSASTRQTPSPTPPPGLVNGSRQVIGNSVGGGDSAGHIEVAVFATAKIKKGEELSLRGGVADITDEEDDKLRKSGQKAEFSVLYSSRRRCFAILLGPARFVNHDCRNNVRFEFGVTGMKLIATEDIEPDQEIFTHYGIHYFEQNNAGCLCATCEQLKRGGYSPKEKTSPAKAPAPAKKATSPTRRSGRHSIAGPPPGSGHELTAQRSVNDSSRARSNSVPSATPPTAGSSRSRRPSVVDPSDVRRNERRGASTAADALLKVPRLVHPQLPPPPLYEEDYTYDAKKKLIKYVGSVPGPRRRNGTPTSAPPSPAPPAKGRKRSAEDSPPPQKRKRVLPEGEEPLERKSRIVVTETKKVVERRKPGRPRKTVSVESTKAAQSIVDKVRRVLKVAPLGRVADFDRPLDHLIRAAQGEPVLWTAPSLYADPVAPKPEDDVATAPLTNVVELMADDPTKRKYNAAPGRKGFMKVKKPPVPKAEHRAPPTAPRRAKPLTEPTRRTPRASITAIDYNENKRPVKTDATLQLRSDDGGASASTDGDEGEGEVVAEMLLSRSNEDRTP